MVFYCGVGVRAAVCQGFCAAAGARSFRAAAILLYVRSSQWRGLRVQRYGRRVFVDAEKMEHPSVL